MITKKRRPQADKKCRAAGVYVSIVILRLVGELRESDSVDLEDQMDYLPSLVS